MGRMGKRFLIKLSGVAFALYLLSLFLSRLPTSNPENQEEWGGKAVRPPKMYGQERVDEDPVKRSYVEFHEVAAPAFKEPTAQQRPGAQLIGKHMGLSLTVVGDKSKPSEVWIQSIRNLIPDHSSDIGNASSFLAFHHSLFTVGLRKEQEGVVELESTQCTVESLSSTDSFLSVQHKCLDNSIVFLWKASHPGDKQYLTLDLSWEASAEFTRSYRIMYIMTLAASVADNTKIVSGKKMGNPVGFVQERIYFAIESPLSQAGILQKPGQLVTSPKVAAAVLTHIPQPNPGSPYKSSVYSTVVGVFEEMSQLRRAFRSYLENRRGRPFRKMLHYNSWFDFYSWQEEDAKFSDRQMNETTCIDRVAQFGKNLVKDRGVKVDSYLFDDGWDNHTSMWGFHDGFPDGFTPVKATAQTFDSGIGVWLSPWGGYGSAQESRLKQGAAEGYQMNENGFMLSDKRYFARFKEIALKMVSKYGVNMFKFDGINMTPGQQGYATEFEAMLQLLQELRDNAVVDDLWINLTTGTWPSPFWLLHGDSVWRGMYDLGVYGAGSIRQRWVTFRDAVVFNNIVMVSPYVPLNSLMLHGIIVGAVGQARVYDLGNLNEITHFSDEVWTYFGMGVGLQEMYISPDLMTQSAWNIVATAAKWSSRNYAVLQDAYWVGGNPGRHQTYGFAAWNNDEGILTVRNPSIVGQNAEIVLGPTFQIPTTKLNQLKGINYHFSCIYATAERCFLTKDNSTILPGCTAEECDIDMTKQIVFHIPPLSVMVIQGKQMTSV